MKLAQFIFRFLCLAVAILQFGLLVNKVFLEVDSYEKTGIEFADSDFGESDSENSEEEYPVLGFFCIKLFIRQDLNFSVISKKSKIHSPSRKLVSHTQSVPFSPPEF